MLSCSRASIACACHCAEAPTLLQAIFSKEGRALGRLVQPRIASNTCSDGGEDHSLSRAVLLVELDYHLWEPAAGKGSPRPLEIPVDHQFKQASYSIKLFGQARGSLFPIPEPYIISGSQTAVKVSLACQQQAYQQQAFLCWQTSDKTPAPPVKPSSVAVVCGMSFDPCSIGGCSVARS